MVCDKGPQGRERSAASAASTSPSTTSLVHGNEVIKGLRKFVEDNRASSKYVQSRRIRCVNVSLCEMRNLAISLNEAGLNKLQGC
jgi:uncharacterized NAD-dependent epimerase/dehydratase family protein